MLIVKKIFWSSTTKEFLTIADDSNSDNNLKLCHAKFSVRIVLNRAKQVPTLFKVIKNKQSHFLILSITQRGLPFCLLSIRGSLAPALLIVLLQNVPKLLVPSESQ